MGPKSFVKSIWEWTTDFLNANTKNIRIIGISKLKVNEKKRKQNELWNEQEKSQKYFYDISKKFSESFSNPWLLTCLKSHIRGLTRPALQYQPQASFSNAGVSLGSYDVWKRASILDH